MFFYSPCTRSRVRAHFFSIVSFCGGKNVWWWRTNIEIWFSLWYCLLNVCDTFACALDLPFPFAYVSLSYLASKLFMKIARLFKENINGKSFKANFYVELSIFLHVHNLHIINIFFFVFSFFSLSFCHFFLVFCSYCKRLVRLLPVYCCFFSLIFLNCFFSFQIETLAFSSFFPYVFASFFFLFVLFSSSL